MPRLMFQTKITNEKSSQKDEIFLKKNLTCTLSFVSLKINKEQSEVDMLE